MKFVSPPSEEAGVPLGFVLTLFQERLWVSSTTGNMLILPRGPVAWSGVPNRDRPPSV